MSETRSRSKSAGAPKKTVGEEDQTQTAAQPATAEKKATRSRKASPTKTAEAAKAEKTAEAPKAEKKAAAPKAEEKAVAAKAEKKAVAAKAEKTAAATPEKKPRPSRKKTGALAAAQVELAFVEPEATPAVAKPAPEPVPEPAVVPEPAPEPTVVAEAAVDTAPATEPEPATEPATEPSVVSEAAVDTMPEPATGIDEELPPYQPLAPPRARRFRARTTYQLRRGRVVSSTRYVPVSAPPAGAQRRDSTAEDLPAPVNILVHGEDGPWEPLSDPVPPGARAASTRGRDDRRGDRPDDRRGDRPDDRRGDRPDDRRGDRRGDRRDDRRGDRREGAPPRADRDGRADERRPPREEREERGGRPDRDAGREPRQERPVATAVVAPPATAFAPGTFATPAAAKAAPAVPAVPAAPAVPAVPAVPEVAARDDASQGAQARGRQTRARSSATIREMLQDERPDVSVAIKTLDGRAHLEAVLRSLMRQKLLYPFEIVALDGGSTDGTIEFLESRGVRVVRLPSRGLGSMEVLDRAFRETVGEMVVFLSQDAEPVDERWLDGLTGELLDDEKVFLAEGRVEEAGPSVPRGQKPAQPSRSMRFTRKDEHPETEALHLEGACIRRSAWDRFRSGADSPDTWLARALAGGGVKVVRATSAVRRLARTTEVPAPELPEPVWQRPIEAARELVQGVLSGTRPDKAIKSALGRLFGRKPK